ncbi:hypothetical protein EC988_005430, partial [Linderina pennispora]
MLRQRSKIAAEILETERTYVEGLGLIEKIYINPLLASAQTATPILTRKEMRQLFANFADIIALSRELLLQLEARLGDGQWDGATGQVGDIFVRMAPFLKMYSLYLRNFRSGLASISQWLSSNRAFAEFLQRGNAAPESRGLSFQSYLLLPVQRIPRYRLLLDDLLRNTPTEHVDYASITDALQTVESVAAFVDATIQEHEMTLEMLEIQRALGLKEPLLAPGRRLVRAGRLTKICRRSHQQRQFYLFSDMLLYAGGSDSSGHRRVPLEDCKVMDVPDTSTCAHQFTIISRAKSFVVYAATGADKAAWLEALAGAITERRAARDTLQMDRSLRRRLLRARRATMLQFPRVAEGFSAPVWAPDSSAAHCYICFRAFALLVRRHHCRACGQLVCHACSRKSIVFVADDMQPSEARACDQCIARMFGRGALESPPGSVRNRHSLDPSALLSTLAALAGSASPPRLEPRLEIAEPPRLEPRPIGPPAALAAAFAESPVACPRNASMCSDGCACIAGSLPAHHRTSADSSAGWDLFGASVRTTLFCGGSPPSTLSRNRISIISSSCSTVVSEPMGRYRKPRRPVVLSEEPPDFQPRATLVSPLAPPELTLAMAETSAVRARADTNATLCALCHGGFAALESQHQCHVCRAL